LRVTIILLAPRAEEGNYKTLYNICSVFSKIVTKGYNFAEKSDAL